MHESANIDTPVTLHGTNIISMVKIHDYIIEKHRADVVKAPFGNKTFHDVIRCVEDARKQEYAYIKNQ